jgi:hypothetical protein
MAFEGIPLMDPCDLAWWGWRRCGDGVWRLPGEWPPLVVA